MTGESSPSPKIVWSARVGGWLVRLLGATWRFQVSHDHDVRRLRSEGVPIVFALWHGEILPLLYHHRGEGVVVLISEHADGEIIARIATSLGYQTVRGSTSRGAARALLGLSRVLREGSDLAITPDGPRGPYKSFAPGVAVVAQRAGAPVIAAGVSVSSAWRLGSWDRFIIPRPFARIRIAYSDASFVGVETARDAAERVDQMQAAMALAETRAATDGDGDG